MKVLIDRKYLDELQGYINMSSEHAGSAGLDIGSIMAQDMLDKFAHKMLEMNGIPAPDDYKVVSFRRDPDSSIEGTGRAWGDYRSMTHSVNLYGYNIHTAMQALLVTAHEVEHMTQDFTFSCHMDQNAETGRGYGSPDFESKFYNGINQFYHTEASPRNVSGYDYADKLFSDPFYAKENIAFMRDDRQYYVSSDTNLYSSNTTEMQANVNAAQRVISITDMSMLHDCEKFALMEYVRDAYNQCSIDLDWKESRDTKKSQLRQAGGSRVFLDQAEREFLEPKDTETLKNALQKMKDDLQINADRIISTDSIEEQDRQMLFRQAEEKAIGEIDDIVKAQGFHYLPQQIDLNEAQGGIAYTYDSMQAMRDVLMTQFIRMDPELHDRIFIDLSDKRIVIDGARDIAHMLADPERTPDIDLDADLTRESLEERGVDGEYHTADLDLGGDDAGLEL